MIGIRTLEDADRRWASALVAEHFGSPRIVSRGVVHDAEALPGLVAIRDGERAGLLLYHVAGRDCEVVVLIAAVPRRGAGTALLVAIRAVAERAGCARLWLVTTNDNLGAQAFYRAVGWRLVAVHAGAVRLSRLLKPEIPARAADGTPIEDEIEFELRLAPADGAGPG